MKKILAIFALGVFQFGLGNQVAQACDVCAVSDAGKMRMEKKGVIDLSVSEQYTHFSVLQDDGKKIDNPLNQKLNSSTTQFGIGYGINERLGVQLTLPFINRDYRRSDGGEGVDSGNVNGLGDSSLMARFTAYQKEDLEGTLIVRFLAGVKFPTGDTDLLGSEAENHHGGGVEEHGEMEAPQEDHMEMVDHHVKSSEHRGDHDSAASYVPAIHDHSLALGSGSIDTIFGSTVFYQHKRFFGLAEIQYFIRSEGDYDYRYANDLMFSVGPGMYVITKDDFTAGVRLNFSGEYKEKDVLDGNKQDDTATTNLYLGPEIILADNGKLSGVFGVDLPVLRDNSGVQVVPDYRLRLGIGYRF